MFSKLFENSINIGKKRSMINDTILHVSFTKYEDRKMLRDMKEYQQRSLFRSLWRSRISLNMHTYIYYFLYRYTFEQTSKRDYERRSSIVPMFSTLCIAITPQYEIRDVHTSPKIETFPYYYHCRHRLISQYYKTFQSPNWLSVSLYPTISGVLIPFSNVLSYPFKDRSLSISVSFTRLLSGKCPFFDETRDCRRSDEKTEQDSLFKLDIFFGSETFHPFHRWRPF